MGQQLYSGKMNTCSDSLIFQRQYCIGYIPFSDQQRTWLNYLNNFGIADFQYFLCVINYLIHECLDWIGRSTFSAYQISMSDTWFETMLQGIDATGRSMCWASGLGLEVQTMPA